MLLLNDNSQKSIKLLESKLKFIENDLIESKKMSHEIQTEFDNYKLKVQHAFRKQKDQKKPSGSSPTNKEIQEYLSEIESFRFLTMKVSEELKQSNEKYMNLEKEFNLTKEEYKSLNHINLKKLDEITQKESEWRLK